MHTDRLLVLAGPTSAGKTEAALWIAERWGAVVVSADAMQVYKGMDVGTGKCPLPERRGVPHVGIDVCEPREPFDASDFVALAEETIARHRRVIVAGGTSLYIHALVRGLVSTPPVDPKLRAELEAADDLFERLEEVDPTLASRLHRNDRVRLVRGLEVFLQSGRRLSELHDEHAEQPDRFAVDGLWLDREDLYDRIDRRVHQMMEDGYLEEVRNLLDAGVHRDLRPMQSLGYRHLCAHLLDGLPLDETIRCTQRDTRRFARKQRNWKRTLNFETARSDDLARLEALGCAAFGQP